ncbi:transcriptional regulator [Nonomuraea spiralis]|nr:transcriptional regulator [Nonomuraea spiralis]
MAPAAAREEEFLKIGEIAARLRVSKMTVYRLIHDGELQGAVRVGRSFRVPSRAVEAYLAAGEIGQ